MANKTSAQEVDAIGELFQLMMFIAGALGIAVYLQILRNRRYWIILEACFGGIMCVGILFAYQALSFYLKDGGDAISAYLFRLLAITMMAQAVAIYITQHSADPSVPITVSITNILMRGSLILCDTYGLYNVKTMFSLSLKCDITFLTMLLIGDLLHLSKLTTKDGQMTVGDPVSLHLSIDAMFTFLFGAGLLGFPHLALKALVPGLKLKEAYSVLAKSVGFMMVGGSLLSFGALTFKDVEDSIAVLKSKLVVYASAVILAGLTYTSDPRFQTYNHMFIMFGLVGALAFNAGYAIWQQEQKRKLQ